MAETLLIRLAADANSIRDWVLVDAQGQTRSPVQTGAPGAGVISATPRTIVLVPGIDVFLGDARVPGRNRQQVLRAIPYAIEEQLATDVEQLHFALGPVQADNHYPVAVVDREKMERWAELLREHGINANQWLPEILAVPAAEEGWSLLADQESVLVRTGAYAGFASDGDALPALLSLLEAREQAPEKAMLFGSTVVDLGDVEVEFADQDRSSLEVLARGAVQGPVLDLLQGAFSRSAEWGRLLRPWRATAALFVAGVLFAMLSAGVDYYRLSVQQEQLTAEINAVFRSALPKARETRDPRGRMEQELKQLQRQTGGGNTDFLYMLTETANVLRATQGIAINGASYRDGRLDLDLQADNLQILDNLKQALTATRRMNAEIQSATTEEGQKVKSRIRIEGVAS